MKNIKNAVYGLIASVVVMPTLVFAQLNTNQIAGASQLEDTSISVLIQAAMRWLLYIVGFLAVIGFVISGIFYLTAAGDEGQIDKAKSIMVSSIVGILVALLGLIIITAVTRFLGGGTTF